MRKGEAAEDVKNMTANCGENVMISILIADDHEVVRRGLRMTLAAEEDMQLVGEASNGLEAVALVRELQPDVLLLDIQMPQMDGIEAARLISAETPHTQILMLTSFGSDARLYQALRTGVTGYLLKDTSGDQLVAAIRGAARGEPQLHPDVARRLMRGMGKPTSPLDALTKREKSVLRLIALGHSNREIGLALSLTPTTIKGYVSTILSKLNLADRTQAALMAVRYGIVSHEELPGA